MTRREVGFWWSADSSLNARYPKAPDCVDFSWDPRERAAVLAYVRAGKQGDCYRGWSDCRICGVHNGSCDLTDGTYVWPEGFAHYIEKHGVKPPQHFIEHALGGSNMRRRTRGLGQPAGAAVPQQFHFEVVVPGEPRGEYLYEELMEAADAAAMIRARAGKDSKIVSPPGSENVVADIDVKGGVRMLHGLGQTAAMRRLARQPYVVLCDNWARFGGIAAGHQVRGLQRAVLKAKNTLRTQPAGETCRVYSLSAGPMFPIESAIVSVRAKGDRFDVVVGPRGAASGLAGDFEELQRVERTWGRSMLARLQKARFSISTSFYVNVAPETVQGLRSALARARQILADFPGDGFVDLYEAALPGARRIFPQDTLIVRVARQGGTVRLTWLPRIEPAAPVGMAGPLTEFVCSDTQAGQMLSSAVNEAIDQGAQSAAVGAIVAGAIGGLLEKPAAGAIAGAVVGYVAHYVWTAPYRR